MPIIDPLAYIVDKWAARALRNYLHAEWGKMPKADRYALLRELETLDRAVAEHEANESYAEQMERHK